MSLDPRIKMVKVEGPYEPPLNTPYFNFACSVEQTPHKWPVVVDGKLVCRCDPDCTTNPSVNTGTMAPFRGKLLFFLFQPEPEANEYGEVSP